MDKQSVILSICIPTYNRGERLLSTIKNILSYPKNDIEIIVLDDCSTDNSYEYISSLHDHRLSIVKNPRNLGQGLNQAKAIFSGCGKYTMALMDRDYIVIKNLEKAISLLKQVKESPIVLFGAEQEKLEIHTKKCAYISCYYTHPSNIALHTKMLKETLNFQTLKRYLTYETTPFIYFPSIVSIHMLVRYHTYSISAISLTKAYLKGTSSGDSSKVKGSCIDYYLPQGAWKRLKLYIQILSNIKAINTWLPWFYAAELHRATLWNMELYNEWDIRQRANIKLYLPEEYYRINTTIWKNTTQYLKSKQLLMWKQYIILTCITFLNKIRIQESLGLKKYNIATKVWSYIFNYNK